MGCTVKHINPKERHRWAHNARSSVLFAYMGELSRARLEAFSGYMRECKEDARKERKGKHERIVLLILGVM